MRLLLSVVLTDFLISLSGESKAATGSTTINSSSITGTVTDAVNYPSGVYFYKIQTEGFADTRRMLLVK